MQNPFIQLGKYKQGWSDSDPQENRATETLAALLVFSVHARQEFLEFLFNGSRRPNTIDATAYEVSTQQQTDDGSWVDLLIENEGKESIVVESKVRAHEDGSQIEKYAEWLKNTRKGTCHYVFSLVKNHDPEFVITDYGGAQHHTWRELYDRFSRINKEEREATDASLMEHFCAFLELEGIVNTWESKEILQYGPGVKAKRALDSVFEQVETRLRELGQDYETKTMRPDREWPRLEVGRTSWKSIFGRQGYLNKVYAWYETSAVRGGEAERFKFEIMLWHRGHGYDWNQTK